MGPKHGLVIGKFYPPHLGHHHLVRTAARACEQVTVVVLASVVESIPLASRVAWMREVHAEDGNVTVVGAMDENRVDLEDEEIWQAHVSIMKHAVRSTTALPVDAVFTSEQYGDELARRFEARHVPVDPERGEFPISGSAVRRDPVAAWKFLAPPVRGWLAKRVVLIGAESTGKSTLAADLAATLRSRGGAFAQTRWVAEYGREHAEAKLAAAPAGTPMEDVVWSSGDFAAIAQSQSAREDAEARAGGPILICDTDAFATSVWHERYMGAPSREVDAIAAQRVPALYLLTHHDDVPFAQDGTRDGEKIRAWMTTRMEERLRSENRPFRWIRGTREPRTRSALSAIDDLLATGWNLAPPRG